MICYIVIFFCFLLMCSIIFVDLVMLVLFGVFLIVFNECMLLMKDVVVYKMKYYLLIEDFMCE